MYNKYCERCNNQFITKHKEQRFCSNKCSTLSAVKKTHGEKLKRECLVCKMEFWVFACIVNRGRDAGKFCSQECYKKRLTGDTNPNWRGGKLKELDIKKAKETRALKLFVRKRDNYCCTKCGKPETDKKHDVHHIVPYRLTMDNSLNNLTTLCISCHRKESGTDLFILKESKTA